MNRTAWIGTGLMLLARLAAGQTSVSQTTNSLTLFGNFGYVRNVSHFDAPIPGLSKDGTAVSLRIMWHPEHLLSAGVEVGRTRLFSVDQSKPDSTTTATLDAVPILFVFAMSPLDRLSVNVGVGPTISKSSVDALGSTAATSSVGAGWMVSAAYLLPVAKRLGVGAELRFLRAAKYDDNTLSLQLTAAYQVHRW